MDKILHYLQLCYVATFKSAGVMENVTGMTREAQFVLDVMLATLYKRDDQPLGKKICLLYLLAGIELLNLVR